MKKWNVLSVVLPIFCALCVIASAICLWANIDASISFFGVLLLLVFCFAVSPVLSGTLAIAVVGVFVMYVVDVVRKKRIGLIGMTVLLTVDACMHIICVAFSWWHLLAGLADIILAIGMMLAAFHRNEF